MKQTFGEKVMDIVIFVVLLILSLTCIFPFINILATSFSTNEAIMAGEVFLWPVGFVTSAYKAVLHDAAMIRSFIFTVILTVTYVAITMIMTILCAYPLSKRRLKGGKFIMKMITVTMYFSGGVIPIYLLVKNLHLLNTMWALILPGAISTFNMIVMKSFFIGIPESLEEAAELDGAGQWRILGQIVLPLSMPIIATLVLFYAVQRWNGFSDALYYINDPKMYPMQLRLRQLISLNQTDQMMNDLQDAQQTVLPETIKAASMIVTVLPIIIVYPWLQKYFVKGVMVGSVKG